MSNSRVMTGFCWRSGLFLLGALGLQGQSTPVPLGNLLFSVTRSTMTIQGVGARSMGLGNAFTAVADDATAVSYNPAGLAQLLDPECTFVGYHTRRTLEDKASNLSSQGMPLILRERGGSFDSTQPLFAAYTLPLRIWGRNVVLQVSHHRLLDLAYDAEGQPGYFTPEGILAQKSQRSVHQDGRVNVASLAVAADLTPRLLAGFALNRWRGTWAGTGSVSFGEGTISPGTSLELSQSSSLRGTQWSMGLIWKSDDLQIGYTYRAPFLADFSFSTRIAQVYEGESLSESGRDSLGLRWPGTTSLGVAWRPTARWLISADWNQTVWSQARFESSSSVLAGLNFFDFEEQTRTPSAQSLHLGVERIALVTPGALVPVRVGIFREPQPDVDEVTGAQRIRRGWSAGIGIRRRRASLDVALTEARSDRAVSDDLTPNATPAIGREVIIERRLYISFGLRFDRERTHQLLKWLLVGR